jgi:hypothetical protein
LLAVLISPCMFFVMLPSSMNPMMHIILKEAPYGHYASLTRGTQLHT